MTGIGDSYPSRAGEVEGGMASAKPQETSLGGEAEKASEVGKSVLAREPQPQAASLEGRAAPLTRVLIPDENKTVIYSAVEAFMKEEDGVSLMGDAAGAMTLMEWLLDEERKRAGAKPRIEERKVGGDIVQLALAFKDSAQRGRFLDKMDSVSGGFELRGAGSTTVEVAVKGISKSSPIKYVANPAFFASCLDQMGYVPGPKIDARATKTMVIADADGTIWETPKKGESPLLRDLSRSPAQESILQYLRAGGVLMINSGNDPDRVAAKIVEGIPEAERPALLKNILLGASGGNALMVFDPTSMEIKEVSGYRTQVLALDEEEGSGRTSMEEMDFIYLGDDHRRSPRGNDWDAFETVGFEKSICVSSMHQAVPGRATVPSELQGNHVQGKEYATKHVFDAVTANAKSGERIFTAANIRKIVRNAREGRAEEKFNALTDLKRIAEALEDLEEDVYDALLEYIEAKYPLDEADQKHSPYTMARIGLHDTYVRSELLKAYGALDTVTRTNYLFAAELEKRRSSKEVKALKAGEVAVWSKASNRVAAMQTTLERNGKTTAQMFEDAKILAAAMQPSLRFKSDGSVEALRADDYVGTGADVVLINGNNDARQVDYQVSLLRRMTSAKRPSHVLVSGFGGHGTSHGSIFSFTEAETLGKHYLDLSSGIVGRKPDLLLEPRATNSGENVRFSTELIRRHVGEGKKIVISGTPSAVLRQGLSFMQQCGDYPWSEVIMIPPSGDELKGYFSDAEGSFIHMMCALREVGSLMDYSVRTSYVKPFVPPNFSACLEKFNDYASILGAEVLIRDVADFAAKYQLFIRGKQEGALDKALQAELMSVIEPMNRFFREAFQDIEKVKMVQRTERSFREQMHALYEEQSRSFSVLHLESPKEKKSKG